MSAAEQGQRTASEGAGSRGLLATCVTAAVRAADEIRRRTPDRATLRWEEKSATDFVSEVDHAAEAVIAGIVAERHPGAVLLAEEGSPDADIARGTVFVVDPLDGTTNFLHGFPWYAVSIAALVDGNIVAGAILNVPTGELFTATAGGGARRAGEPIRVSGITTPARALVGTGMPFKSPEQADRYLLTLPRIMRQTAGVRRPGSAALDLADVACGRFDGFWEPRLAPWDIAAGILLVREAGGVVTDYDGTPATVRHTPIVAGNPAMHAWLLEQLQQ
ncbi:MAG TPA: inositol monophosphatase family protein [Gemmatimonadaceae bacterium]|nr:inositol monophosphatase family protein [Gemmatimonadaceae bacterium]